MAGMAILSNEMCGQLKIELEKDYSITQIKRDANAEVLEVELSSNEFPGFVKVVTK